jgi:hypothetical protein
MIHTDRISNPVGGVGERRRSPHSKQSPRTRGEPRMIDTDRLSNAVGGHGGGAPPLPPIQNEPCRSTG